MITRVKLFYQLVSIFLLLGSVVSAQNAETTHPILSPPTALLEQMQLWARRKNATKVFVSLSEIYWEKAIAIGINPVIAYVQSALETGFGRYDGSVRVDFNNPCGLKKTNATGDKPDDFAHFDSWIIGIEAHLDHLALYAGASEYPKKPNKTNDPRHFPHLYGCAPTVETMSKLWAADKKYGEKLIKLIKSIETE
jgi:hypothetical protein